MLREDVPARRRRCVLCVAHVRSHLDLFGRPFSLPHGFAMPTSRPSDALRLSQLRRCPSCASMRHFSLLHPTTRVTVFECLYDPPPRTDVLHDPVPPSAPRCPRWSYPLLLLSASSAAGPSAHPVTSVTSHRLMPPPLAWLLPRLSLSGTRASVMRVRSSGPLIP